MHRRSVPGLSLRRLLCFPAAALTLALAACGAPAAGEPTASATPAPTSVPTITPSPAPTATALPSPTPTATETPAALPISPATLAQLRPLWVLNEPGNPNAEIGCEDVACWMVSRLGGYAFSPDGATFAVGVCTVDSTENTTNPRLYRFTCDGPAEVRLYDSATGDQLQSLPVGDFPLSLAFHPGGRTLAVGMAQRSIEVWDLDDGSKVQTLLHSTTHTGVERLAFSLDGEVLISDGDGLLQLWLWETGLPAGTIENASGFALSPLGGSLATVTWAGSGDYVEARFYPLDDPSSFRAFRLDWRKAPSRIVYTPDGSAVIAIGAAGLEVADAQSGEILRKAESDDLLRAGGLDGFVLLTSSATEDGRLMITVAGRDPGGEWRDGPGLWDPRTDGAHVSLLTFEEQDYQMNGVYFLGFAETRLSLADGGRYLLARDPFYGVLWIWGIDPTASPEGVTCLGACE